MRVRWSKRSISDLEQIFDYYNITANQNIARTIIAGIVATTKLLKTNPNCGQIEELLMYKNYRRIVEGNHKIIYFIENETVIIVTVFDSRQNPDKLTSLF